MMMMTMMTITEMRCEIIQRIRSYQYFVFES